MLSYGLLCIPFPEDFWKNGSLDKLLTFLQWSSYKCVIETNSLHQQFSFSPHNEITIVSSTKLQLTLHLVIVCLSVIEREFAIHICFEEKSWPVTLFHKWLVSVWVWALHFSDTITTTPTVYQAVWRDSYKWVYVMDTEYTPCEEKSMWFLGCSCLYSLRAAV